MPGTNLLELAPEQEGQATRVYSTSIKIDCCVQIYRDGSFWDLDPGVLTAVVQTAASPLDRFYEAMQSMADWHALGREFAERVTVAATVADVLESRDRRKTAVILGFQSPKPIEDDLRNLEIFCRQGLRVMQIAYNTRSYLADGSTEPDNAGLSLFGRRAIREMNDLGIVVDLSHVGERSGIEAAGISRAPIICSHSNPRQVCDNPRNISDHEIEAIAATGGVVGVSPWGPICWREKERGRPTIDDFLAHIEYVLELVGIDHIGVGTDFSVGTERLPGDWYVQRYPSVSAEYDRLVEADTNSPRRYATNLDTLQSWPNIARAMVKRGFSTDDIRKVLGGNLLRVFTQVWNR